jgi:HEPN domain-containing protein
MGVDDAERLHHFEQDIWETVRILKDEISYDPRLFIGMVHEHGPLETSRRLIVASDMSYGFQKLYDNQRLHLTVEAHALLPWYTDLFTERELEAARRKLEAHGFEVDRFIDEAYRRWPAWDADEEDEGDEQIGVGKGATGSVPLDVSEFDRWRKSAATALAGANHLSDGGFWSWACFGAEQAAQFALKGLLHGLGVDVHGHDLRRLAATLEEAGVEGIGTVEDELRNLSRLYIPTRYPDAHISGEPETYYGERDATGAIEDAEAILRFVDEKWSEAHAEGH